MNYLTNLFSYFGFNSNKKIYDGIKSKYSSTEELFKKLEYYNFNMTKHLNMHYEIYKHKFPKKEDYFKSDLYLNNKNDLMYKACRSVQLNNLYLENNIDNFLDNCTKDELNLLLD